MTDATTAAKAIQNMSYPPGTAGHAMAGVVLARLNEAITHLDGIRDELRVAFNNPIESKVAMTRAYSHYEAALACLRNEDT